MSLSDTIIKVHSGGLSGTTIVFTDEVKKSINDFKEEVRINTNFPSIVIQEILDNHFGKKLSQTYSNQKVEGKK